MFVELDAELVVLEILEVLLFNVLLLVALAKNGLAFGAVEEVDEVFIGVVDMFVDVVAVVPPTALFKNGLAFGAVELVVIAGVGVVGAVGWVGLVIVCGATFEGRATLIMVRKIQVRNTPENHWILIGMSKLPSCCSSCGICSCSFR